VEPSSLAGPSSVAVVAGTTSKRPGGGRVRFGALERQHAPIEDQLRDAFLRVVTNSSFILGEEVERFEAEFASYCEVNHCVGVSSGTAALSLMLRASGVGPADEVIVPAHTFVASALAVAHVGAVPILCDVDAGTGLIDLDAARTLVGPRTAAIIAVHLYGQACDVPAIEAFARPHGLLVLEDAAQAHGARFRARPVGSLGAAAAFSFYPSKNLGALGDGGAICTDDAWLAARIRRIRNLGQRRKGEHIELGYNERLDGLQAALLRVKLPYLDGWNAARRRHACRYRELLPDALQVLAERPESPCIYHLFPVRVGHRDAVAASLSLNGIESGVHYEPAVHQHLVWTEYELRHGPVPNAEAWAAEELSLPMHPDLGSDELERVAEAMHAVFRCGIG
jgi:dTDP-3-amino-3,4,6-trideoxy-alpha-D-glucose transaminase